MDTASRIGPMGWVCQAVRAPGAKVTRATCRRKGGSPVANASFQTWPVNC